MKPYLFEKEGKDQYEKKYLNIYNLWYSRLKMMAVSSIRWKNQPFYPSFNVPERWLINMGKCVAFKDIDMGFMILPCIGTDNLNAIGEPSRYRAQSQNGWISEELTPGKDCVIILNNPLGMPDTNQIANFAERLTEIQITELVNLNTNKTPVAASVSPDQKLTALNLYSQFSLGKPVIFENDEVNPIRFDALVPNVPFLVPELSLELRSTWAEWLTYLGIPALDISKTERFLKDEIEQVMGGALASRSLRMQNRKLAAEEINNMFDMDLEPEYAVDSEPLPEFLMNAWKDTALEEEMDGDINIKKEGDI